MKRRANGEGHVRQRKDGRWEAQVSLGDGRIRSVYGASQRDVMEKRVELLKTIAGGLVAPSARHTLGEYLEEWLAAKAGKVRPAVHTRYASALRVHVIPTLGKMPLAKVGPQHLERLYGERIRAGASTGTVHIAHAVLHNALEQAVRWGQLARNVCDVANPPKVMRPEMRCLSEEQLSSFLAAAKGNRFEALFVVAVTTGMRQGELLALRWQDLALDRATLSVTRSLCWTKGGPIFNAPKTKKSRRSVELTKVAVAALRAHRTRQLEQRLAIADAWDEQDLVFPNEVGRPMDGSNLSERDLARVFRAAAITPIRFHDLRHTAATVLLGRGVHPKIVSEMLGHADVRVTLDLYSHVTPTMQREAASVFDQVIAAGGR